MDINLYLLKQGLLMFFMIIHYIILARIIMSFLIQMARGNPVLINIYQALAAFTEPLLAPIRKLIPPVRMGMGYMDLSPIILLLFIRLVLVQIVIAL